MTEKIYVVVAHEDKYYSRGTRVVTAYRDEAKAREHASLATARAGAIKKWHWDTWSRTYRFPSRDDPGHPTNEHDPGHNADHASSYEVETVELK